MTDDVDALLLAFETLVSNDVRVNGSVVMTNVDVGRRRLAARGEPECAALCAYCGHRLDWHRRDTTKDATSFICHESSCRLGTCLILNHADHWSDERLNDLEGV